VNKRIAFLIILSLLVVTVSALNANEQKVYEQKEIVMKLWSPDFKNNGLIPRKFTCDGQDVNPNLITEDIAPGTESLTLIVDDPDAPVGIWVHWVVFNIALMKEIKENSIPGVQGINDFRRKNYGGPCPPGGTHRYFFKLYALDTKLNLAEGANKSAVEKAMQGHIVAQAELVGLYKR